MCTRPLRTKKISDPLSPAVKITAPAGSDRLSITLSSSDSAAGSRERKRLISESGRGGADSGRIHPAASRIRSSIHSRALSRVSKIRIPSVEPMRSRCAMYLSIPPSPPTPEGRPLKSSVPSRSAKPLLHLKEEARGRVVHRLHAAEVEEDESPLGEILLELREELVRGPEEEIVLELDEEGVVSALLEERELLAGAAPFRADGVEVGATEHDRAAHLIADEEEDREADSDAGRLDQPDDRGDADDRDDHDEVEPRGGAKEEAEHPEVEHPPGDHDQHARERGDRHPGDRAPQSQERGENQRAGDDAAPHRPPAARDVDQRRPHRSRPGDAAREDRREVRRALRDELAVRFVPPSGQGVEHDARLERVDREKDRERQRGARRQREVGGMERQERGGARGDRAAERSGGRDRSDHEGVPRQPEQLRPRRAEREVGADARGEARDRRRNRPREARHDRHDGHRDRADEDSLPPPARGRHERVRERHAAGRAEQARDLRHRDDDGDSREISRHDLVGDELDEAPRAQRAVDDLQKCRKRSP